MNSIYHRVTALAIVFMLLLSPAVSFAKNNENKGKGKSNENRIAQNDDRDDDDDDDNEERRRDEAKAKVSKKEARQCFKAFGHLIAKGFIKKNGEIEFPADCYMPFGIKKKFRGTASSTDTMAPVISGLSVQPNTTRAVVTWQTNENSDTALFWSTTPNFSPTASTTQSLVRNESVKNHSLTLEGLTASTTYYLIVRSKDAAGNTATSSETSFRTHSLPTDSVAPVISNVSYMPGTTTLMFSWQTNENANSRVYYSTTTPLNLTATSTGNVFDATLRQNHLLTVSGLTASTTYYIAVESLDQSGNKTTSPSFTVSTQ